MPAPMSACRPVRLVALLSVAGLAACATAQENPNYKFSSKYGQQGDSAVQSAGYPVPATVPVVYQGETALAGGYGTEPTTTGSTLAEPAISAPALSETEAVFDAATMDGTPGYAVMMAETGEDAVQDIPVPGVSNEVAPPAAYARPQGVRPVTYDDSQNVIIAGAQVASEPAETRQLSYSAPISAPISAAVYTVQPGDTVYSLSRRFCVGLGEIASGNDIGTDYKISIGQVLTLPASRC